MPTSRQNRTAAKRGRCGSWGRAGILLGGLFGLVLGAIFVMHPLDVTPVTLFEGISALIVCAVECAALGGLFGALTAALSDRVFRGSSPRDPGLCAVFLAFLLTLQGSREAQAVEGGISPYLKGSAGFMSGYIPPPSSTIPNKIFYHFDGSADASVRNGRAEFGADVSLGAGLWQAMFITEGRLFGGAYGFGGALGYVKAEVSATLDNPIGGTAISQKDDGIGDSVVVPILVGWHDGKLHMNASLPVYIPTGDYNLGHVSVGKNTWAFMPQFAMTWFDPMTGWDISGAFSLVFSTNNEETDYQSGTLLHIDWAVGKHFGAWELGIAGNIVEQISDDSGSGAVLGGFRAESFGIGPAINYNTMLFGRPFTISGKWQPDLSATNTFKGDVIMGSLLIVF